MDLQVQSKNHTKIYRSSVLQQTSFWSEFKRKQGFEVKAFEMKARTADLYPESKSVNAVEDDLLVILQSADNGQSIAYVPYGPKINPSDESKGPFLEALSELLRSHLPAKCAMIRYDLPWESPWAKEKDFFDENGHWIGPPKKENQEMRLNFTTHNWRLEKAPTNILPSDTFFMDLRKSEEQLLAGMKGKTRYNTRLAARKGVTVRQVGFEELEIWYKLYRETCLRNDMVLHEIEVFKTIFKAKWSDPRSSADLELLIAEKDGLPLAAMFLVYSNQCASYLYGASSSSNRHYMAPYALQWEAIKRAKARGCRDYDMFGSSPNPDPSHPLYGLYRFKRGFGGYLFHRMGCWDYPIDRID